MHPAINNTVSAACEFVFSPCRHLITQEIFGIFVNAADALSEKHARLPNPILLVNQPFNSAWTPPIGAPALQWQEYDCELLRS